MAAKMLIDLKKYPRDEFKLIFIEDSFFTMSEEENLSILDYFNFSKVVGF